ncbi:hypothetical protein MY4824_008147 [Beauveria thailandica]
MARPLPTLVLAHPTPRIPTVGMTLDDAKLLVDWKLRHGQVSSHAHGPRVIQQRRLTALTRRTIATVIRILPARA